MILELLTIQAKLLTFQAKLPLKLLTFQGNLNSGLAFLVKLWQKKMFKIGGFVPTRLNTPYLLTLSYHSLHTKICLFDFTILLSNFSITVSKSIINFIVFKIFLEKSYAQIIRRCI